MRLIYRFLLRIALIITLVLSVWSICFYMAIIDEINDETDDSLEDYSEAIILRALTGEELPAATNGTNNQYYLHQVSESYARSHPHISYKDSMIYLVEKGETEPARILTTLFQDGAGHYQELTVSIPTIEKKDLKESILTWNIILFLLLLLSILLITMGVFYRSLKPLYRLLHWLEAYRLGVHCTPLNNPTGITEFRKLNEAVTRHVARSEQTFEQQKQFIGNASHEIQTPLAICQNRLELLMDDEHLTEVQLTELQKTHQTLAHISRLNKSLLLLTKIDNKQFTDTREVDLGTLASSFLSDYQEAYASRKIDVDIQIEAPLSVWMDESLASILITNLLKNAFVHNVDGGKIHIMVSKQLLTISNSAPGGELDANRIFERFYQGEKKEGSTGLGLSIAHSICQLYGFHLNYHWAHQEHYFQIDCR